MTDIYTLRGLWNGNVAGYQLSLRLHRTPNAQQMHACGVFKPRRNCSNLRPVVGKTHMVPDGELHLVEGRRKAVCRQSGVNYLEKFER